MTTRNRPGEGDQEADRRYRERTREFIEQEPVADHAREAEPDDEAEARELAQAERDGRARAREKDPNVERDYSKEGSH